MHSPMTTRETPYIDEMTAYQWAAAAADSMRCLPQKGRTALIRMLLDAILSDGRRILPGGTVVYVAAERKLHTLLAVQHLASRLLAAAQEMRGFWEPGAWNMTTPAISWQINLEGIPS